MVYWSVLSHLLLFSFKIDSWCLVFCGLLEEMINSWEIQFSNSIPEVRFVIFLHCAGFISLWSVLVDTGTPLSLANEAHRTDQTWVREGVDGWGGVRCKPRMGMSLHEELLWIERRGKKRLPYLPRSPSSFSIHFLINTHCSLLDHFHARGHKALQTCWSPALPGHFAGAYRWKMKNLSSGWAEMAFCHFWFPPSFHRGWDLWPCNSLAFHIHTCAWVAVQGHWSGCCSLKQGLLFHSLGFLTPS